MKPQITKLAIFDIDGTIFRSSLIIELINGLVQSGIFSVQAKKDLEKEYLAWLDRKGSYEAYINKVVKIYAKYIAGKSFARVSKVAQEVISFQKDRVYRFTRDLIKRLKKQGYLLVAISGSPSYIVEGYAKAIGFGRFFGTEPEIKQGRFTGKIASLDSAYNKAKLVKGLAAENPRINLKQSVAVGDTESDIAMLGLVGKPIAFNPNLQLARYAKQRGWQMVVERKDVIYNIKSFSFLDFR